MDRLGLHTSGFVLNCPTRKNVSNLTTSSDLIKLLCMKPMLVSEFEAKCIAALKEVQRTREPMLITLRSKPLAIIQPAAENPAGKQLGGLKGKMEIHDALVQVDSADDWDMLT